MIFEFNIWPSVYWTLGHVESHAPNSTWVWFDFSPSLRGVPGSIIWMRHSMLYKSLFICIKQWEVHNVFEFAFVVAVRTFLYGKKSYVNSRAQKLISGYHKTLIETQIIVLHWTTHACMLILHKAQTHLIGWFPLLGCMRQRQKDWNENKYIKIHYYFSRLFIILHINCLVTCEYWSHEGKQRVSQLR